MTITGPVRVSDAVAKVLIEALSARQLRALAAAMESRNHIPDWLAIELADELGDIFSMPPVEFEGRLIYNRPTIGWWTRRKQREAEARSHG